MADTPLSGALALAPGEEPPADRPASAALGEAATSVGRDPDASPRQRPWWRRALIEGVVASAVGLVSMAAAFAVYRIRPTSLDTLWNAGGDLSPVVALVKGVEQGHGLTVNPMLGYPGFLDAAQFPVLTDAFHWGQLVLLVGVTGDAVAAVNLYVFVGFFSTAFTMYLLLRYLTVFRAGAAVLAASVALLPWHFARGPDHIFLANVTPAIVGVGLAAAVWRGAYDVEPGRRRVLRVALSLPLAVIVGTGGIYYAFISTVFLLVVLALRLVSARSRALRWPTAVLPFAVPAAAAASVYLNERAQRAETIVAVTERFPSESQTYAGSIATLFLPDSRGWLGQALLGARPELSDIYASREGGAAFHLVAIACLLATLALLLLSAFGVPPRGRWRQATGEIGYLQGLLLVAVFFFATLGGGALFAYLVTPELRAWGRFSVVIAVLAVCAAGVAVTVATAGRRSAAVRLALAVGAATLLVADTATLDFADYVDSAAVDAEARGLVSQLEASLAPGCPILQLPLLEFPEVPPVNDLKAYDPLIPYLVSSDLRWSFGGNKGTQEGRWGLDRRDDLSWLGAQGRAVGFCGVLVDTAAFAGPADLQRFTAQFGDPDLVSANGRWVFFEWDDRPGLVPTLAPSSGYSFAEEEPGRVFWWQVEPVGLVAVTGFDLGAPAIQAQFGAPPCGPADLEVNGTRVRVPAGQRAWADVPVRPDGSGAATLEVRALGPACSVEGDRRPLYGRLFDAARPGSLGPDEARSAQP